MDKAKSKASPFREQRLRPVTTLRLQEVLSLHLHLVWMSSDPQRGTAQTRLPVSYTHLDVYKRQQELQLKRGETTSDTAQVLSRYVHGIMIRTFDQQDVEDLANYGTIPVINGLTDLLHPCQVLADYFTVYEKRGKTKGLKMVYVGDGNNMAHSLMYGLSLIHI